MTEERRVELGRLVTVAQGELRDRGVEGELDPTQKERVANFGAADASGEETIREVELVLLRLASELPGEFEEL